MMVWFKEVFYYKRENVWFGVYCVVIDLLFIMCILLDVMGEVVMFFRIDLLFECLFGWLLVSKSVLCCVYFDLEIVIIYYLLELLVVVFFCVDVWIF